jgi:hypothetical protein
MPTLFYPPSGPLPIDGTVQTTQPAPDSNQGIRRWNMVLLVSPFSPEIGINIPVIVSVGYYEDDSGQVQIISFDNFGQGSADGTPGNAIQANSQVRQSHPGIVYNLDSTDPWTGDITPGSGNPSLIVERVDQFAVYDPATAQSIATQNDPLNTDPDGNFQGGGQVSVYAIDNYGGDISGAALPFGSVSDVTLYDNIDHAAMPPDFSKAGGQGGVHNMGHVVRGYGGIIQTDDSGDYVLDNNGDAVITLDPSVWADIQFIDIADVIDDDGQERYFTLTMNPVQEQFQYPGSDVQFQYPNPVPGPIHA